jgi:hypothetical protein
MPGFVFTQQLGVARVASTREKKRGGGVTRMVGYGRWKYKNNFNKIVQTGSYSFDVFIGGEATNLRTPSGPIRSLIATCFKFLILISTKQSSKF